MGVLYLFTFPNGKHYVGVTVKSLPQRMRSHRHCATKVNPKLAVYRAWIKYGEPLVTVLAIVEDDDLYATEVRAILAFDSFGPNGYNMTPGGDASPAITPSVALKIKAHANLPERIKANIDLHTGRKRSPETCERIAQSLQGKLAGRKQAPEHVAKRLKAVELKRDQISAANTGKKRTPEQRARQSEAAKARWARPESDAHRSAISARQRGRKVTPEQRARMSEAAKNRPPVSDETRAKLSANSRWRK